MLWMHDKWACTCMKGGDIHGAWVSVLGDIGYKFGRLPQPTTAQKQSLKEEQPNGGGAERNALIFLLFVSLLLPFFLRLRSLSS